MTVEIKPTKAKEIRNLLFVIGSAVACALILSLSLLYYYNPSGRYLAKNVLLAPQIMSEISYPEVHPQTGNVIRYMFDSFEFAYWDAEKKETLRFSVGQTAYREFYEAVSNDESIQPVSEELRQLFNKSHLSALTVRMQMEAGKEKIIFQEIYFDPGGDFYKVQLRQSALDEKSEGWVYFFHPGIKRYVEALFANVNP